MSADEVSSKGVVDSGVVWTGEGGASSLMMGLMTAQIIDCC